MRRQSSEDGDVTAAGAEAASNLSPRKSRLVLADCSDRSIDVIMSSGFAEDDSSRTVEWPTNGPPGIPGSKIISDHVAFLEAEARERQAEAREMDELCKENAPNETYTETYTGKACHERNIVTVTVREGEGEVIVIQDLLDEEPTQVSGGTKESPELLVEETTKEPREEPDEETTQEPEEETAQLHTPPAKKLKVDNSCEKEPVVPKNNEELLRNTARLEGTPCTEPDRLRFWTELERGQYWTRRGPGSVLDADDDVEQNTEQQHC